MADLLANCTKLSKKFEITMVILARRTSSRLPGLNFPVGVRFRSRRLLVLVVQLWAWGSGAPYVPEPRR